MHTKNRTLLTKFTDYLVAAILIVVPFHPFLTVLVSSHIGNYTPLRLTVEVLLVVLLICCAFIVSIDSETRRELYSSFLIRLILAYTLFTLIMCIIAYLFLGVQIKALVFSAIVTLRFLIWFMAVWTISKRSGWLQKNLYKLLLWPFIVVIGFAFLQFFFLPAKFLTHFGYDSLVNIAPVTTINQTGNVVRVQSFLRGPNPFGTYLIIYICLLATLISLKKVSVKYWLLSLFSLLILFLTFSRSAWLGAITGVLLVAWLSKDRIMPVRASGKNVVLGCAALATVISVTCLIIMTNNATFHSIILHDSPESEVKYTSNRGHLEALRLGAKQVAQNPFGTGPGSVGPASLYNNSDLIVGNSESYFLEIGQETGWIGLGLFLVICFLLGKKLLSRRHIDPMALPVFASFIGISVACFFSYAWTDLTIAYTWWGMAAIILAKKTLATPHKASPERVDNQSKSVKDKLLQPPSS